MTSKHVCWKPSAKCKVALLPAIDRRSKKKKEEGRVVWEEKWNHDLLPFNTVHLWSGVVRPAVCFATQLTPMCKASTVWIYAGARPSWPTSHCQTKLSALLLITQNTTSSYNSNKVFSCVVFGQTTLLSY